MSSLREELEQACTKVRRQIEVQNSSLPMAGGSSPNTERKRGLVAELQAELTELEAAFARLGPGR